MNAPSRFQAVIDVLLDGDGRIPLISANAIARASGLMARKDAEGKINGQDFEDFGIPMIVRCSVCDMTMVFFSAMVERKTGRVYCSACSSSIRELTRAIR